MSLKARSRRRAIRGLLAAACIFVTVFAPLPSAFGQETQRPQPRVRSIPNAGRLQVDEHPPGVQPPELEQDFGRPSKPASSAQPASPPRAASPLGLEPEQMLSPEGLSSTLNVLLVMTVVSLAPSILIMTTCFIRFAIVLGLLRQALGTQQLPPNQVMMGLSLFLTFLVMSPVWQEAYTDGIKPYTHPVAGAAVPSMGTTFQRTIAPVRRFMSDQIERSGNSDTVWMFLEYQRPPAETSAGMAWREPETYEEVPLTALLPAYMLSELKTSFLIGFQIFLPFLIIDMVVAAVLMSMGMMMLPPTLVSFPFKLLLFVLIDGWSLTVGMLLDSVRPFG